MKSLNPQIDVLGKLVSATEFRQKVISHNLANVNTPEYKRLEVDFETMLSGEMKNGTASTSDIQPVVRESTGVTARADGNTVDIDIEIGQLNKNALLQQVYLQLLGTELSQMKMAIQGG
ncbi:MAG: flagellar basal body rod protein FlgB [Planctomyces sp.]|jgi:flagellar basal-body rod protein FlgB